MRRSCIIPLGNMPVEFLTSPVDSNKIKREKNIKTGQEGTTSLGQYIINKLFGVILEQVFFNIFIIFIFILTWILKNNFEKFSLIK